MPEVIESFGADGICAICKRNPVKRWCDYVVSYDTAVTFLRDYKDFVAVNGTNDYETCDLPMCDKCATKVGRDRDLCPHHLSLHSKAKLPNEYLQQRQREARFRMYKEAEGHRDDRTTQAKPEAE